MKKYIRWYDKDKYLSAFMALMQRLPNEAQIEIASDMLLNFSHIVGENCDDYINKMSNSHPQSYKRWYDFNPTLHIAIEAMQNLTLKQREEVILSVSDILFSYTNLDFEETVKQLSLTDEDL